MGVNVFLLLLFVQMTPSCTGMNDSNNHTLPDSKRLFKDLFSNYGTTSTRPVKNFSEAVEVEFYYKPTILSEFDEQNQRLSVIGSLYMGWVDEFLVWDPADYGGIERLSVRAKDIWFPDITAYERLMTGTGMANLYEPYAIVHSNGQVNYHDVSDLTVYCRLEMTLFPFDTQKCNVTFTSYSYDLQQFSLRYANTSAAFENSFDPNGVWRLDHFKVAEVEQKYRCCPLPYLEVHYSLVLQRIGNFYVYSIWIPSGLLSTMILAVFVMHPNSGEKVSLSVSNVLAFVLFQQIVVGSMPRSGDDSPVIVAYFSAMIAISCLSVLASAVVLRVYHHDPKKPVPRLFRWLCLRKTNGRVTGSVHVVPRHTKQGVPDANDPNDLSKEYDTIIESDVNGEQSMNNHHSAAGVPLSDLEMTYNRRSPRYQEETDWMILALMMDKILLAIAVVALFGTLLYCLICYIVLV